MKNTCKLLIYKENSIKQFGFHLLFLLIFIGSLTISLAAQSVAVYSDEWGHQPDGSEDLQIVGSGVTEASYYSFGFSYGVEVTLTSPTGVATTQMSSWYPTYATTEIWTPWNSWYGTWYISTRHITWNWYQNWFYNYYSSYSGPLTYIGIYELGYKDGTSLRAETCRYDICNSYTNSSCYYWLTRSSAIINYPGIDPDRCPLGLLRLLNKSSFLGVTYCTVYSDLTYTRNFCQ
ncbi:MAG: hypothetical protein H0U45_11705 [Tatlockia sp.]|jgi:hypothetical protein|nr:hypothetical protein [Tatlockia sp.]